MIDDIGVAAEEKIDLISLDFNKSKDSNKKPDCGDTGIKRSHYNQAFSFYFEDYDENNLIKTSYILNKYSKQLYSLMHRFGCVLDSLLWNEIWEDVIIEKTANIFYRKKEELDGIENLIMDTVKHEVRKFIIKREKYYSELGSLEKELNSLSYSDVNGPQVTDCGGSSDTPIEFQASLRGEICTYIFLFIEKRFGELYSKVYRLSYIENKSDKEIYALIKMPINSFKNIRRRVTKYLRENKQQILDGFNAVGNGAGSVTSNNKDNKM